jgi:eukaryotic-like serine/threonine-protein kinase
MGLRVSREGDRATNVMLRAMAERITGDESTVALSEGSATPGASLPPPTATPAPHVLGDRYEIVGLVGAGGMGTVYRARDKELDEVVALKLLRRDLLDQPGMLERFRQEVKLARRVTHRNVARTYDIGESDGEKFLTMEFVEGQSLSSRLAHEGALALDVALDVADGICAGLSAAHDAGIVHRDLKPDNVMIAADGRIVLTDFGIARALADPNQKATVGVMLGTPAYMAPEQVEGAKDLDARADIYALGAILYECLTGASAWSGDSVWGVAAARLLNPPPDPRAKRADVPPSIAQLIQKCMARRREDRFATAREVSTVLAGMTRPAKGLLAPTPPPPPLMAIEAEAKKVAVLPFRNAGQPADDYLAEGLCDDLIDALSMTSGLRVLAKGALGRFKGPERDPREIGRDLRVDVVVDGSVRRAGDALRISVRVVSVTDGFQLWAKRFDRSERDVFAVSDEAADAIAQALTLRRVAPAREAPGDARALDLYLRARHARRVGWRDKILESIGLYEQALALAPNDPTILAGYAQAQLRSFMFDADASGAAISEQKGREAAAKALAIAPHLGEARAALANVSWLTGESVACAREVREAIRVAPSSTDVNELYGRILLEAGEPRRGLAVLTAIAELEPGLRVVAIDRMRGSALLGDWSLFESALEARLAQPSPDALVDERGNVLASYFDLVRMCLWRKDPAASAALHEHAQRGAAFPFQTQVLNLLDLAMGKDVSEEGYKEMLTLGNVTGRSRRRPALFRQVAAEVYAFRGDRGRMLGSMASSVEVGLIDVTWVDYCPLFATMRNDPGFVALRAIVAARAKEVLDALQGPSTPK